MKMIEDSYPLSPMQQGMLFHTPSPAEGFWREQLRGFGAPTQISVAKRHSTEEANLEQQTASYAVQALRLSSASTATLQSLAQTHDLTLNTLVQGAWALLLSRYSTSEDVVFGATRSCRHGLNNMESMVGLFINILPVRVKVRPDQLLLPWLKNIRTQWVALRDYEHTPLAQVSEWSEVPRGEPLFDSILMFENSELNVEVSPQDGGWEHRDFQLFEQINYPLTLRVYGGLQLSLKLNYDTRKFEGDAIARMLGHLTTLLEGMAINPQQRLCDLPLLTTAEQHQLLVEWNDTQTDYPKDACINQLFESQVEQTPDAVAVVFEDQQLTYRELNCRANQLAHYLQRLGVEPDVLVGICVERSLEMVVGLLGILKAGGAYVPLDSAYPQERLSFMFEDSHVSVLLTQQRLVATVPEHKAQIVCLDAEWEAIAQQSKENPVSGATPTNLAYVIYTSGSTGKPKGVAMNHRPLVNLITWQLESSKVKHGAKTLQFAPVSFDVSFQEIFSTWCSGGILLLISDEMRQDAVELLHFLTDQKVERLFLPFVALEHLAEVADSQGTKLTNLRELITAGEQLQITRQIANLFSQLEDCILHNHYGPSESHVITASPLTGSPHNWPVLPPIGRPINNTQIYILNSHLQPVPIGLTGELYIGGIAVARGYLNRPELTSERFIPNPFKDELDARLYKTGDLARYNSDCNIQFLGRIDHQVKIRGYRIELGEIEATLIQHPNVKQAVVIDREDIPNEKCLVAYVVPNKEQAPTVGELRRFLKGKLPDYMVPSAFVLLEVLPLTPNGKVDRRTLPMPVKGRDGLKENFVAPNTVAQKVLAEIWCDVLGFNLIGIQDNFFELGGNSLLGFQVITRVQKQFGADLRAVKLYQYPTIYSLAKYLSQGESEQHSHQNAQNRAQQQKAAYARQQRPKRR